MSPGPLALLLLRACSATATCTGSADPPSTAPYCYSGNDGTYRPLLLKIVSFANSAGVAHVIGSGILCENYAFTKSGQSISTNLDACTSGFNITSIQYCSDTDDVLIKTKRTRYPYDAEFRLANATCPSFVSNGTCHAATGDCAKFVVRIAHGDDTTCSDNSIMEAEAVHVQNECEFLGESKSHHFERSGPLYTSYGCNATHVTQRFYSDSACITLKTTSSTEVMSNVIERPLACTYDSQESKAERFVCDQLYSKVKVGHYEDASCRQLKDYELKPLNACYGEIVSTHDGGYKGESLVCEGHQLKKKLWKESDCTGNSITEERDTMKSSCSRDEESDAYRMLTGCGPGGTPSQSDGTTLAGNFAFVITLIIVTVIDMISCQLFGI